MLPHWVSTVPAMKQGDTWVVVSGFCNREPWLCASWEKTHVFISLFWFHCAQPCLKFFHVLNVSCLFHSKVLEEFDKPDNAKTKTVFYYLSGYSCPIINQQIEFGSLGQADEPSLLKFQLVLSIKPFTSCWFSECDVYKVWYAGK